MNYNTQSIEDVLFDEQEELISAGWLSLGCDEWVDPVTECKYNHSIAYEIYQQRKSM